MLMRYDPFRDMLAIQERMNRLVDDLFHRTEVEPDNAMVEWKPLADVFEDDNHVVISLDIPGMKKEDITITVENNTLIVRGERKLEKEEKKKNYHRLERLYGTFSRSFNLPGTVDTSDIRASYQNGSLELQLPKREEAKPRAISVKVG